MTLRLRHRLLGLLPLLLLAACMGHGPEEKPVSFESSCRVGPNGVPLRMAERGIGGTGGPDRARIAERGIGGTGIVGVVSGFASICVDGLEVPYDRSVRVEQDGRPASVAALRAGQVVVIQADGPPQAAHARRIAIMHEVAGRIENVQPGSTLLTIAGQSVSLPPDTWGWERFTPGDWVAVSGLRRPDGVIVATRLDASAPNRLMVRGPVASDGSTVRIGDLILPLAIAARARPGQVVMVTGAYAGNRPVPLHLMADQACDDPARCFGDASHVVIQAFVRSDKGAIWLNGRRFPVLAGAAAKDGLKIVSLERQPDGSFAVADLRTADLRTARPLAGQAPPNRAAPSRPRGAAPASTQPDAPAAEQAISGPDPDPADASSTDGSPPDAGAPAGSPLQDKAGQPANEGGQLISRGGRAPKTRYVSRNAAHAVTLITTAVQSVTTVAPIPPPASRSTARRARPRAAG